MFGAEMFVETQDEVARGLDLSVQELEVMVGPRCGGNVSQNACDASLGGALGLALVSTLLVIGT